MVEMSSNYDQRTTTTHTTLHVSQRFFDLVVTEISAKNEIPIQSLSNIRFRSDGFTHFEPGPPVMATAFSTPCLLKF